MILMVHGYGLNGSGSNLWTRSVVAALCEKGVTVHLCCQERRPEAFDFIKEVIDYDEDGRPVATLTSEHSGNGGCILHRPSVATLPTYVRPSAGASGMASILDMSAAQIEEYLSSNERALLSILGDYPIDAIHVNHVLLMAEAVRRAATRTGRPFAVMPHGSAIEYVAKKSADMHALARKALTEADRILVLNDEMRRRVLDTFPGIELATDKMIRVPVGVDVRKFRAVERAQRPETIAQLIERVKRLDRGRDDRHSRHLMDSLTDDASLEDLKAAFSESGDFPQRHPDADFERSIEAVDWDNVPIVGYVGRVLGHKGVHALLAAFPLVLDRHPAASLVIAGSGPLREWLEAFKQALGTGRRDLVHKLVRWGGDLEGEEGSFPHLEHFYADLATRPGDEDDYFRSARNLLQPGRVVMTGYLDHAELSMLFGCLDVGVFPSIVREASPLVVPEAMAAGVFPMGTDFGGMAASLDHASQVIPEDLRPMMRIRVEAPHMVGDIARNVAAVLSARPDLSSDFHAFAEKHYDWQQIASRMVADLEGLTSQPVDS